MTKPTNPKEALEILDLIRTRLHHAKDRIESHTKPDNVIRDMKFAKPCSLRDEDTSERSRSLDTTLDDMIDADNLANEQEDLVQARNLVHRAMLQAQILAADHDLEFDMVTLTKLVLAEFHRKREGMFG